MSKKLISSNDSESSKALFGTIIENQHIQSTVINDLSDRLDKMDTRIDSLDTDVDGSGDINTNNALIENDLSVKKDTNDPAVGYKTVLGNDMELGVGQFESKFLRGLHQGAYRSSINAIYYNHWTPVPNSNNHVRLIHPEIKLAHPTPTEAENTGSYNTFQIGPLGTSKIDSTGSEINGVNNNSFIVNLREQINNNNNNDNMLSVKMVSVCTQNDGPHISFENVSPDVNSSSEVAYIGAQVLTDNTGDQGSLVFKTLKTTSETNTNTGATTIESACEERLRINEHGAVGIAGTNFGDAGAVLTSNGNAASVSWTTKETMFTNPTFTTGIAVGRSGGFAGLNLINTTNNHSWRFAGPGNVFTTGLSTDSNGLILAYIDGPLGQSGSTETFTCHFNSNGSLSIRNSFFGNKTITVSDDRLKFNEEIINNGLETILQLNPTKYDKSLVLNVEENTEREAGFIAQEVFKIPELKPYVIEGNQEHPWRINYTCIIPYLVSAIKELKMQVEELKK